MVTKNDADGEYVQDIDYAASPRHTTAYAQLTINTPGKYFARMVNYYDKSQVWALPEHRGNLTEYFAKTMLTVK